MLLLAMENGSTVHVNSGACFYYSSRTGSGLKLNALNRVQPNKKKLFYFLFLIVFY